ncbi:tryptophan--tRNA ligase [Gluconobacter wancherniae]|uniref:Tryptophan--tRNA ligase n=1 Tax=Gluconobacter wancherniae NBRC 103581 TaxID=656744 RepID=A0A511B950_9PROT|nr:tryptophan--tRNA ligase [Gluconobacter wancherniae]MBF0853841.1 tryptophan--tRNA ligase [Gluconobacter wancherniae]MBS1089101.1 tryptophan--tRNA ligase [Gluconobacter wancherniae]MBS1094269.1 tryptophan--tRNA ligase [Gluconobacter wancherniae]MBS1094642.1 tryptophan--tRNA ligase [Gluconobacter wancherniae]GBD56896.1 tryptophan--tRNA ligase [Gluconobacter wancherniae NBRC 103581]
MQRVFSGIQPTGIPHLGNYLGAIRNWATLQADHDCLFCLVDMHSLTMPWSPQTLREQTLGSAACLLAAGIDPTRLYNQSAVSAHARLGWIFNCVSRLGWLNRMTQFKDKAGKNRENHSAGLYVYPNLMAADILAFHATRVPVGDDQLQHLELANDIAQKFNHDMGVEFFPKIEPLVPPAAARVMSLRDGTKKMSKSDPSAQSRIVLTDTADEIAGKIRRAKTDSEPLPSEMAGLAERPEARNLVTIYAAVSERTPADILSEFGGQGFGPFKNALAELLVQKLAPIATETSRLLQDETHLLSVLRTGAERARSVADPIVNEAESLVGFLR